MAAEPTSGAFPLCFLHPPKSGGTSVQVALRAKLPAGALSVKALDTSSFCCGFEAFDELREEQRHSVLVSDHELDDMAGSMVVSGHFCLGNLRRIAPPESISTVLREPRSRILSLYAFWSLSAAHNEAWLPYRAYVHALRPLDEFLSEPQLAPAVDNGVCRMLLHGDPRIPRLEHIAAEHVEALAAEAIARLDELGFVGLLERGTAMWEGLSRFFGVTLDPSRTNVTSSAQVDDRALPLAEPVTERTLDLLQARTAADSMIYAHAVAGHGIEMEHRRISESAFAAQLVRLGDLTGNSAATAQSLHQRNAEAQARLSVRSSEIAKLHVEALACRNTIRRLEAERAGHLMTLESVQRSAGWRVTRTLRSTKRRLCARARWQGRARAWAGTEDDAASPQPPAGPDR